MLFSAPSWKRAVDWSAVAPGGVTDSSRPGSVGHLVTEVTKCALPAPVAGRSTTSICTLTGGSLSAQHAFCVKNVYWLPQIPWIVRDRVGLPRVGLLRRPVELLRLVRGGLGRTADGRDPGGIGGVAVEEGERDPERDRQQAVAGGVDRVEEAAARARVEVLLRVGLRQQLVELGLLLGRAGRGVVAHQRALLQHPRHGGVAGRALQLLHQRDGGGRERRLRRHRDRCRLVPALPVEGVRPFHVASISDRRCPLGKTFRR